MIETLTFRDQVESVRPPGAAKRETKALFLTALRFRDGLDGCAAFRNRCKLNEWL